MIGAAAVLAPFAAEAQTTELRGQLQMWTVARAESPMIAQVGVQYIPEGSVEFLLTDDGRFTLDGTLALNLNAAGTFVGEDDWDARLGIYRFWTRFSTEKFEARVGRQQINFGSALIFRPLRWFDSVDPRDPLQITEGVNALLLRYYFENNANIWVWGLTGNRDAKGNEIAPSRNGGPEVGGRVQLPVPRGEFAGSYHYRRADFSAVQLPGLSDPLPDLPGLEAPSNVPEHRLGLDAKWDVEVGLWFEGALFRRDQIDESFRYQSQLTVGMDYTIGWGNGVTILAEHILSGLSRKPLSEVDQNVSGTLVSYPLGLLDRLSALVSYDWEGRDWFRTVTWDRQYDSWRFVLLGFWNPEEIATLTPSTGTSGLFTGLGVQVQGVYNH
jgi:hypothetical protein